MLGPACDRHVTERLCIADGAAVHRTLPSAPRPARRTSPPDRRRRSTPAHRNGGLPIESAADRMCLKVRHGKGGKNRHTLLSPRLLAVLRTYWRDTRPQCWLFPNRAGAGAIEILNDGNRCVLALLGELQDGSRQRGSTHEPCAPAAAASGAASSPSNTASQIVRRSAAVHSTRWRRCAAMSSQSPACSRRASASSAKPGGGVGRCSLRWT